MLKFLILSIIAVAIYGEDNVDIPCVDNEVKGFCVPYYLCDDNGTITNDASDIISYRRASRETKPEKDASEVCDFSSICCKQKIVNNAAPSETDTHKETPKQVLINGPKCGVRKSKGVESGVEIEVDYSNHSLYGEFPWMMAILRIENDSENKLKIFTCGGALVHPRVVVTAAQCVNNKKGLAVPEDLLIRGGEWSVIEKETHPHQDVEVEHIFIHKGFKPRTLVNDIAVLVLKTPMEITETVDVVCTPDSETQIDSNQCFVTGWGKINFGRYFTFENVLKKIEVPLVEKSECQKLLRQSIFGNSFELHESFICAGGEKGKDACTGDGGSPLVCAIKGQEGRYQLKGIVSAGVGNKCGIENIPGLYTDVQLFKNWINEQLINISL